MINSKSKRTQASQFALLVQQQNKILEQLTARTESSLDGISDAMYGIAESLDFIAASDFSQRVESSIDKNNIAVWSASVGNVLRVYGVLEKRWLVEHPAHTQADLKRVRVLIKWLCDVIYQDMGVLHE